MARTVAGGARWIRVREPALDLFAYCALCRVLFEAVPERTVVWSVRPAAWAVLRTAYPEHRLAVHLTERDPTWVGSGDASPVLLGRSVHDRPGATAGEATPDGRQEPAQYLLLAPVFPTASKPDATPVGLAQLAVLATASAVPIVALGGVTAARVAECRAAGVAGVAASGAVLGNTAPDVATGDLLDAWSRWS